LDSGRWQTISAHFSELAEMPAAERARALARLQEQDPEVADEVRSLLEADDPDFLATPANVSLSGEDADPELAPGTPIGPYHIVETLGEGGMGIVYLADRKDEQFERRVALKIIKRGMDTHRVVRRFQAERQILASLTHPNIAHLYDGGMTDDGLPYFSMEYVDGLPIDRYCVQNNLDLEQRLRLLCDACAAVQHAHQNLVVHGDLKPSNVLVTRDGKVKLLDFGIATLLDDRSGTGAPATLHGLRPFTPEFASPEQARGEPLTTAADIFSLGVLLHVLLTNQRPHELAGVPALDIPRVLEQLPPPCPSALGTAWARRLRGDLDTIVQVAMHSEPARRHTTAMALADDLCAHLEGRPVSARRDSVRYRAGKFVRRNRLGVGLTAAAFVLSLGFAGIMGGQARRIENQSREIVRERDRAEDVTAVLVDMFDVSDPINGSVARGDTMRVLDFLQLNEKRLTTELRDQPQTHAGFAHLMSRLYANLGHYDKALELIEESVTVRRAIVTPPDVELARGLDFLGTTLDRLGRSKEAEVHMREALDMRRALNTGPHLETAESLNNLAWCLSSQMRFEESLELDRQALEMRRRLQGSAHPDVAQSLNNLASSLLYLDRLAEAEPLYREALRIRQTNLGNDHPYVANTMNNLGRLLCDMGSLAAADSLISEAIAVWSRTLRPDHPEVAAGWLNLALVAERSEDLPRAVEAMQRALAIDMASLPAEHPFIAQDHLQLGRLQLAAGRAEEAVPMLRQAHAFYLRERGPDDEDTRQASELLKKAEERRQS